MLPAFYRLPSNNSLKSNSTSSKSNMSFNQHLEFVLDLRDVYTAFIGMFEENKNHIDYFNYDWGLLFKNFDNFLKSFNEIQPKPSLAFNDNVNRLPGWPTVVNVDKHTLSSHICTSLKVIEEFIRLISKRYQIPRLEIPKNLTIIKCHSLHKPQSIKYINDLDSYM